jgi:hypothetical protein
MLGFARVAVICPILYRAKQFARQGLQVFETDHDLRARMRGFTGKRRLCGARFGNVSFAYVPYFS